MGWTCFNRNSVANPTTYEQEKKEIIHIYSSGGRNDVLQASKVGSVWYVAVNELETEQVWAGVCMTQRHEGGWGYKDMSEDMIPYHFEAPMSLIKKLTPTENKGSLEWREKCRINSETKKAKTQKAKIGKAKLSNGMTVDVSGLFGTVNGKELKTMQIQDLSARKFWCPDVGILYTLKQNQVKKIAERIA